MAAPLGTALSPSTLVTLTLRAQKLKDTDLFSKSDPLCVVKKYEPTSQAWYEIGRTEVVMNNLNPDWAKTITIDYFFEERQKLKFEVYDIDSAAVGMESHDFLGRIECELAEIVSAGEFSKALTSGLRGNCGWLFISSEEVDQGARESVQFSIRGEKLDKKDFFGKSDPYLSVYRRNDDGSRTLVHRTEFLKKTVNPVWRAFEIDKKRLCGGDDERSITIECWDDNHTQSHSYIGSCTIRVQDILQPNGSTLELINEKKKARKGKGYKNSGVLQVQTAVIPQFTFLDFIAGGTQLDFSVAVDFTASNGEPHLPQSLHYINQYCPNQYEVAIRSVLDVCKFYNNSKIFEAFGFGATIPPSTSMTPVFDLANPQNVFGDPSVINVEGVLNAYHHCINKVRLYGPTNFSPVIHEVVKRSNAKRRAPGERYQILLIITDGAICDMAKTKRIIVEASSLPLSIIIVGVGNADFDAMDELDGDEARIQSDGRFAERDIVQFVPLNKFIPQSLGGLQSISAVEYDRIMARLAKEVLAEVPGQVTSFMKSRGIQPRSPKNPFPKDPVAVDHSQQAAPPPQPLHAPPAYADAQNLPPTYPSYPGQHQPQIPYPSASNIIY